MNKVIFTQRVEVIESYQERRDCSDQRIAQWIRSCGYLPVPVPNHAELLEEFLEEIRPEGIILTGGNSLVKYGGNAPERDAVDRALVQFAEKHLLPLYGFCRGMQSILDYYGNKLVNVYGHVAVRHKVCICGEKQEADMEVNSYHNQACLDLDEGCGLKVMAKCDDGAIEAVCHNSLPIMGTMWHPERESRFSDRGIEGLKKLFVYRQCTL